MHNTPDSDALDSGVAPLASGSIVGGAIFDNTDFAMGSGSLLLNGTNAGVGAWSPMVRFCTLAYLSTSYSHYVLDNLPIY